MPTTTPPLGNLVRIAPLEWNALPPHLSFPDYKPRDDAESHKPENSDSTSSTVTPSSVIREKRPQLIPFIKEVLDQGVSFIDEVVPRTFKSGREKKSPPADAKVQLLKRDISAGELLQVQWSDSVIPRKPPTNISEAWFGRRSRHTNRKDDGTAVFAEFAIGLRDDHSDNEREYTPDVYDSYRVLDWDAETVAGDFAIDRYTMVRMSSGCLYRPSQLVLTF
jgi:hypothetical protein